MHPWVKWPPIMNVADWCTLETQFVFSVSSKGRDSLIDRLDENAIIRLDTKEFEQFVDRKWDYGDTKIAFAVRAIGTEPDSGKFTVYTDDGSVWVRHGMLGRVDPKEIKVPLVIILDFRPKSLYVDRTRAI